MRDFTQFVFSRVQKDRIDAYVLHQHLGSLAETARQLGMTRDKCDSYVRLGQRLWEWIEIAGIDPYSLMPLRSLGLSTPASCLINHLGVWEKEAVRAELRRQGASVLEAQGAGPVAAREVFKWLGDEEPGWLKWRKRPQQIGLEL